MEFAWLYSYYSEVSSLIPVKNTGQYILPTLTFKTTVCQYSVYMYIQNTVDLIFFGYVRSRPYKAFKYR
jgi:hypothetical protein